jgi:hypothetical protein
MIRDRDRIYGTVVTSRLRAMGIRDKPIAPSSPWQNGFAERIDRINPARLLGPRYCFGRGTSAPDSKIIRRFLQLRRNASVFAEGCADFPPDSSDRNHSFTPDPRRASPSLRPGLSFRYTQSQIHIRSDVGFPDKPDSSCSMCVFVDPDPSGRGARVAPASIPVTLCCWGPT